VVRRRGPQRAHSGWVSEDRRSRAEVLLNTPISVGGSESVSGLPWSGLVVFDLWGGLPVGSGGVLDLGAAYPSGMVASSSRRRLDWYGRRPKRMLAPRQPGSLLLEVPGVGGRGRSGPAGCWHCRWASCGSPGGGCSTPAVNRGPGARSVKRRVLGGRGVLWPGHLWRRGDV
jgi:hypothetical protein